MTNEEAKLFAAELVNGKSFATRFQEDEWGLDYKDGKFIHWGNRGEIVQDENGLAKMEQKSYSTEMSEDDLMELLTGHYSYIVMTSKLK